MGDRLKNLIKDTLIFALGNFGSKLILFFMVPLYTNVLSTEEYGIAEYVFTLSQLLVPVVSISIWEGVVRIGLAKGVKKEDVLVNSLMVFGFSVLIVTVSTPIWQLYERISNWRVYLSLYSLVFVLNQIELNYLKIKEKNKVFAITSIIQTIVLAIMNIILLVKYKLGIEGYLIANIIGISTSIIFAALAGGIIKDAKCGHYNRDTLIQMIKYSAPLILNNVSWWIIHSSDKIMIETMLTTGALGLYTVASKIPSLINVLVSVFTQAWGISSIKEIESTNEERYYTTVFEYYSIVLFSAMLCFTIIVKPFMSIYVGIEFIDSWRFVPLLFFAAVFQAFSSFFGGILGALKKSSKTMTTTIIGGVTNVVINYIGIIFWGVWGALIGTVSAFVIITIIRIVIVQKEMMLSINWKRFAVNSCICLACVSIVSSVSKGGIFAFLGLVLFLIINRKKAFELVTTLLKFIKR